MQHERAFHLGSAHAVARYVDDVVNTAGNPVIAIFIPAAAVACKIFACIGRKIGLHETVVIAINGACLARPAVRNAQIARCCAANMFIGKNSALIIDELRLDAKERPPCAARFHAMRAGQGCNHHAAGLCLPPCVDNGQFSLAHRCVIPTPSFGIDGLTHRAQQAQRRARARQNRRIAIAHQRAQCRWRSVENVHLMPVNNVPETPAVGVAWNAFEYQAGSAIL